MYWAEGVIVNNEFIHRRDTYNIVPGGANPFQDIPIETRKDWGRIGGIYTSHHRLGICGVDKETLSTWGKKGGGVSKENQLGIHGLSKDQIIQNAKKGGEKSDGGNRCLQDQKGIHGYSQEQRQIWNKQNARIGAEKKAGFLSATKECRVEWCRLGGLALRGKICINNGIINQMIPKDDPIPDGWVRGRARKNGTNYRNLV